MALPQYGPALSGATDLRRFVTGIEDLGFDTLWAAERLVMPLKIHSDVPVGDDDTWASYLDAIGAFGDPFPLVAAAAVVTDRIRFNFGTLNAPLHQPIRLAQTLTTLDVLSDGRIDAGFGLSWVRDEYDILGLDWSSRGRHLDDVLDFLRVWWTDNPVEYKGPFVSLPPARVDLRPVQAGGPPIYLGGSSHAALARVGRRAKGWIGFDQLPDEAMASFWETARHAAEEAGRDPDALRKIIRVNGEPGESVSHLADRLSRQVEMGADEVMVDLVFTYKTIDERLDAAEHLMNRKSW
ncbi:TIGR03619 family F420-dependent LLM class oxidoreductase [Mycolicibacterium smegmatis]|uniref:Putative dehydrogenase n=1 Tax=Mycolicibacterium smegmatis (strain MKD8) TaxID=1214915 RepID=A0A2U9PHI1_MYCSE|nr:TIGR03619 family F420-dependent LLM class oxidoreductase [Mycolicibacterium smegmatis]AWT51192.1 putative dehydrogenase [Mycolicibacterium smegmatis MKD8]